MSLEIFCCQVTTQISDQQYLFKETVIFIFLHGGGYFRKKRTEINVISAFRHASWTFSVTRAVKGVQNSVE